MYVPHIGRSLGYFTCPHLYPEFLRHTYRENSTTEESTLSPTPPHYVLPNLNGSKNGFCILCFCASYCLGLYTFVGHLWFPYLMDPFWESAWVLVMKTYRQYLRSIGIWSNQFFLLDGCHNCLVLHNNHLPSNASVLTCAQSCLLAVSCTTSSFIQRFSHAKDLFEWKSTFLYLTLTFCLTIFLIVNNYYYFCDFLMSL